MASELVRRGDRRAIYLALGFRNGREHLFRSHLAELADEAARLTLDVSYSRPLPTDRIADADSPGDYHRVGRVDAERLKQLLPSNNFQFYLCGPAAMMEALAPALVEWGVPVEDVHYEAFGPATVRGLGRRTSSSPCQVEFARSGRRLAWTGDETSLLELAERNGLTLDAGCRAGSCGQCRLALAAGLVRHAKPPGVALADGECLACIAQPEGDVIVDA
jgi:ferredoxin-NADP reductase